MIYAIELLIVFAFCATAGWILEVIYRSTISKRFVNPGFLTGCALPIYGIGGLLLYIFGKYVNMIDGALLRFIVIFIGGSLIMTLIELVGGIFLLKAYNIMLWDYTNLRFNYKGLICLRFSFYWGICCIFFFIVLFPLLQAIVEYAKSTLCIFLTGMYFGIFVIDVADALNLAAKLKEHSTAIKSTVNIEKIKLAAIETAEMRRKKKWYRHILPHNSLKSYLYELKAASFEKRKQLKNKITS